MGLILCYLHLCCGHIQRMFPHSSEIQKRTSLLQITGLLELAKWTDWSSWGLEPKTNSKKNVTVAFVVRLVRSERNGNMTDCKTVQKMTSLSCCNIMFCIFNYTNTCIHIYILFKNLHVCTVHQWQLKHFIIQQMHKYIFCRYN